MKFLSTKALCFLMVLTASAVGIGQQVETQNRSDENTFAKPVRIMSGSKFMGEARLYPSPTFQDLNGDGKLDVVIGDLFGHITVAYRDAKAEGVKFGPKTKIMNDQGKALKFSNW